VFCFDSPIAIAMTGVFTTFISCFVNAYPNKKLINYSYFEQMKDVLPSLAISIIMLVTVLWVGTLPLSNLAILLLQVLVGIIVYFLLSAVLRVRSFVIMTSLLKQFVKKK